MIGSMLSFVFNDLHNFTDKYLLYACDLLVVFANYALWPFKFVPALLFLLVCKQDLTHTHINS